MLTDAQIETLRNCLAGAIRARPPILTPGVCLDEHHRGATCTACADSCPAAAIDLIHGTPQLNTDRCMGCGLCLAACPVEAWRQDAPPERKLVEVAAGLPDGELAVVCSLHPQADRPAAPLAAVVRHRRCLATLDLGDLLAVCGSGKRTVWLDDSPCMACLLQAADVLRVRVVVANELLAAYGQPARLKLASATATRPSDRSQAVLDGGQPKVSRRRLVEALRGAPTGRVDGSLTARQRLLIALPNLENAAEVVLPSGAPFAQVSVDVERCSGCGLCAHFCPTTALTWTVTESDGADNAISFELDFRAAACVACPICTLACPEEAVETTNDVSAADLIAAEPVPLVSGRLVACVQCGALTAALPGDSRCHVCRHSMGPVTPLHDGAGLMADLLRRSAPRPSE